VPSSADLVALYPPLLCSSLGFFYLTKEAAKRERKCHVRHACYV
jgi:hypothetical protein